MKMPVRLHSRDRTRHRLTIPVQPCDEPIRRLCPFEQDVRTVQPLIHPEVPIQFHHCRLILQDIHPHAAFPQHGHTFAAHLWMRIQRAHHDTWYPGFQDQVRARRCLPEMVAGLKAHIKRAFPQQATIRDAPHSIHLRMGPAIPLVPALTDDPALMHDHSTYTRIWLHGSTRQARQVQTTL